MIWWYSSHIVCRGSTKWLQVEYCHYDNRNHEELSQYKLITTKIQKSMLIFLISRTIVHNDDKLLASDPALLSTGEGGHYNGATR